MNTMSSRSMLSRRQWCGMVGLLCAPTMADDATEALIRMLPAFQHFPEYLFTPETAQAVAEAPRRLACPDFAEIKAAINAYRREFIYEPRPALPAPDEPARKGPTEAESAAVHELVQEAIRGMRAACLQQSRPFPEQIRPLPDVTLKGDALRASRAARGLRLPPEAA